MLLVKCIENCKMIDWMNFVRKSYCAEAESTRMTRVICTSLLYIGTILGQSKQVWKLSVALSDFSSSAFLHDFF